MGRSSAKVKLAKNNPQLKSLRRFLGVDGGLGEKIGLSNYFTVNVIKATGNYGQSLIGYVFPSHFCENLITKR